jgi:hypothetical protein
VIQILLLNEHFGGGDAARGVERVGSDVFPVSTMRRWPAVSMIMPPGVRRLPRSLVAVQPLARDEGNRGAATPEHAVSMAGVAALVEIGRGVLRYYYL